MQSLFSFFLFCFKLYGISRVHKGFQYLLFFFFSIPEIMRDEMHPFHKNQVEEENMPLQQSDQADLTVTSPEAEAQYLLQTFIWYLMYQDYNLNYIKQDRARRYHNLFRYCKELITKIQAPNEKSPSLISKHLFKIFLQTCHQSSKECQGLNNHEFFHTVLNSCSQERSTPQGILRTNIDVAFLTL